MHKPWMKFDIWGNTIPAKTFLDGNECRAVGLEEFRTLAERCDLLAWLLAKYRDGDISILVWVVWLPLLGPIRARDERSTP